MSTILSQYVLPTKSLAKATAPCNPVYVHLDLSGYATYSLATATAWILLAGFGMKRLTVALSSSLRTEGIVWAASMVRVVESLDDSMCGRQVI